MKKRFTKQLHIMVDEITLYRLLCLSDFFDLKPSVLIRRLIDSSFYNIDTLMDREKKE